MAHESQLVENLIKDSVVTESSNVTVVTSVPSPQIVISDTGSSIVESYSSNAVVTEEVEQTVLESISPGPKGKDAEGALKIRVNGVVASTPVTIDSLDFDSTFTAKWFLTAVDIVNNSYSVLEVSSIRVADDDVEYLTYGSMGSNMGLTVSVEKVGSTIQLKVTHTNSNIVDILALRYFMYKTF